VGDENLLPGRVGFNGRGDFGGFGGCEVVGFVGGAGGGEEAVAEFWGCCYAVDELLFGSVCYYPSLWFIC
jgi:hypothetical protein